MFVDVPKNADMNDAASDLGTALSIARMCYTAYIEEEGEATELFFASNRENIREALGAIVDYIRSAKSILDSLE